jgi:DHA1 family tetracycline resistance protein-like MFS transporter
MFQTLRNREAAMPFIMLAVLIDMAAIGVIVPVLPVLVASFSVNQADQAYWYGVVAVAFGMANFLGSPLLGALSDRFGRRPVLLLGFMGLGISFFGIALTDTLWGLIVVRTLGGLMQGNIAIANAYVADISSPEQRAKRFGLLGAMMGVGFIVGPVVGGLMGAINLHLPFYLAGSLTLLNLLYGYFVLPESLPLDKRKAFAWRDANPIKALKGLAQLRGVSPLVGVVALSGLAQFVLYTVWVLYNAFKFGWGAEENGYSLTAVGVTAVLVQGVLMGPLLKRFKPQRLAIMGLVSSALGYFLWGAATEGWMMYAVIGINLLGGTVTASVQSLISSAADSKNQGQTMGAVSSLNGLMAVLAPMLGAPLLATVSHFPQGDWRIGAPFFFCAALQVGSLVLAVLYLRRHPQSPR